MVDDNLLHDLPAAPEAGFVTLVSNLDKWLGTAGGDEDHNRRAYSEILHAYIKEHHLDINLPERNEYSTRFEWWTDYSLDVIGAKAACIFGGREGIPAPNSDLPDEIKDDYEEARSIVARSPRGAAALLRLAIQKLCKHLGERGKKIDDDIGSLVKKGIPVEVQQALDAVRVIGNEAVHPGQIDLSDNPEIANTLFQLVNFIAERMISQPKAIEQIYMSLPPEKRAAIQRRDHRDEP